MSGQHPFLPNLDDGIVREMLKQVGASSISELFSDIPPEYALKQKLSIPEGQPEATVRREVTKRLSGNLTPPTALCFLGGGVWPHYIPAAVESIISRQEFYTSYTPYQPEISQGILQALFEYQSLMCDLLGMQACNSSMYDWASSAAEAVRMVARLKNRDVFLVAESIGPQRRDVIKTYVEPMGLALRTVKFDRRTGGLDQRSLDENLNSEVAGIYLENPNFFGVVEEGAGEAIEKVHRAGGLGVVGVDPMSLSVLKEPGRYEADVVVGEGQPLGIPMNFGGPHLGIFAVREMSLARSMPGRMIGMTTTKEGNERAYCMVLQTREQHIRREHASSNICTNQALLALFATVYLSALGKSGFQELGKQCLRRAHYAQERICAIPGFTPLFTRPFFDEFAVACPLPASALNAALRDRGIIGGYDLSADYPELGNAALFCVTEARTRDDIESLATALEEITGENA
ncbi:MAG: aminomethyl-transferring glycine dehydrogenase subunit GcvPA [Thaumarchaeota archaeon]|nr:aminomethyl-transferring glycine dehydrogenase subunit GcvPA [Nitrososphaerota archaeon]